MIIRAKAPLRLGFAGGGTDVNPYCRQYGGNVLNATIDMFAFCTIEPICDKKITIAAVDRDEMFQTEASDYLALDGLLDLHKGVYNKIVKEFNNNKPLSFNMTTYSDAPAGSGLGTSSTMVVAILNAFKEWLNIPLGEYDIAALAYEIERVDIGLNGGRQDQYAATFGGFNFMEFYNDNKVIVNPLRIKDTIINELENSIVLYYTGVSRDSAKIITEQAKNTEEGKTAAIEAMHQVKKDAFILKEFLLRGQIQDFALRLNSAWQTKKKMASAISNKNMESVYEYAFENGAIGGKVSGAGGGGYMMFMVDPVKRVRLIKALNRLEGEVMNFHFNNNGTQAWRI